MWGGTIGAPRDARYVATDISNPSDAAASGRRVVVATFATTEAGARWTTVLLASWSTRGRVHSIPSLHARWVLA